ncbi:MAG: glycosyl hydrolase 115 family protein [Bacteroidales bacterium]|nr:glycosyl hydrolase 115 family protein [Bacteroidales bacterium]
MRKIALFLFLSLVLLGIELCYGTPARKDFVTRRGEPIYIQCDTAGSEAVMKTALEMLAHDCAAVLDAELRIRPTLDSIAKQGSFIVIASQALEGWEHFSLQARAGKLFLGASDAHGMAYGLLELSRMMGVSPWEWWADATPRKRDELRIAEGTTIYEAPDVPFRGIFINDEDWGLMPWSTHTYEPTDEPGRIGPKTYARVFELLLRLRANTIWPAMHEVTVPFFLVPGNRETAARYGIYMGGSHCEPMACSAAGEWRRRGIGDYDYVHNANEVYRFWEDRVREVKDQEILYTIGMRGVHDGAMQGAKTVEEQKEVLTRVFEDQRKLLAQYVNKDVSQVPQVFIPYKEVLDVYNAGLVVPDDVCLMWCDDNYGYIRHFPTEAEAARAGGNGIYYHVSYWGRPHDYLWLGTFSPGLLYQQMRLAYDKGIRKIWILNVGDIKPAEYQTELFMDMAWNIDKVNKMGVKAHERQFYAREFGEVLAHEIQLVMEESYRLAFVRKPEFMGNTRTEEADRQYWSTVCDLPWSKNYIDLRLADYRALSDRAEEIEQRIPADRKDAFFQLVKYPVQAADQMNRKILYGQYARHGMMSWEQSDAAYDSISRLTRVYNTGIYNEGKWNKMMDFKPRSLSVFDQVSHSTTDAPLAEDMVCRKKWNGTDGKGIFIACEGLGYEGRAIQLRPNETVSFVFISDEELDSVTVELHLLPTHPVDGEHLSLEVAIDKQKAVTVDYLTKGRSEEWKENVLNNQAVKTLTYAIKRGKKHTLKFKTPYEGIVVDQIFIR